MIEKPNLPENQSKNQENQAKNQPKVPKEEPKLDEKQKNVKKFLENVGKSVKSTVTLGSKNILYTYEVPEKYRNYDEIGLKSGLNFEKLMKPQHVSIAKTFQEFSSNWKYVKIKSNLKTDQISVLASLNATNLQGDPY